MLEKIEVELINNNLEEVIQLILENNDRYKDIPKFLNIKGVLALKMQEYDIAINNLEYALKLYMEDKNNFKVDTDDNLKIDISYNLAFAYENNSNIDKALVIYNNILNEACSESDKLEAANNIELIKNKCKKYIYEKYGSDVFIDENEYGKIIIKDLTYKEAPSIGRDIYEVRRNLNKLREDINPLVSIYVLAYNNLEKYTKPCVESILKYTTDIDYELVLVDNGSTDETYEYFKTIQHDKKKIIKITKNVGIGYQALNCFDELNGKYIALLCNDTIVTQNWLSNMIKCAQSDPKIGMICPASDYISNLQAINLEYKDLNDMQEKAKLNNVSNPCKWSERLKLVTVATLFTRECIDMTGIFDYGYIHDYSDDDISFRVRRAGYKAVLCKDSFISHRGEFSDKGIELASISMKEGSNFFKNKYYGIDPQDVLNYELGMLSLIDFDLIEHEDKKILGVDVLCGTPILELKNKMREKGIFGTKLSAFSTHAKYWLDLNTICDDVVVDRIDYILEHYEERFDYIILGQTINSYKNPLNVIENIIKLLKIDGTILLKLKNMYDIETMLNILNQRVDIENQLKTNIDIDYFNQYLNRKEMHICKLALEKKNYDKQIEAYLSNININKENDENYENIKNKLSIENYVLKINFKKVNV